MRSIWQRHDALATNSDNGSTSGARVFKLLVATSQGLVTSRPSLLGVSAQILGVGVSTSHSMSYSRGHSLDRVATMVVTATEVTVSNAIEMIGTEAGLSIDESAVVRPTSLFI